MPFPIGSSPGRRLLALALVGFIASIPSPLASAAPLTPGPRPDGTVVLHNQWPIKPVGQQVPVGDFPVATAVSPDGRWAAVLNAGYLAHSITLVDLAKRAVVQTVPVHEAFAGLAFSPDGRSIACSGGSDGVVDVFPVSDSGIGAKRSLKVANPSDGGVVAGVCFSPDGKSVLATVLFGGGLVRVDVATGSILWKSLDENAPSADRPVKDDSKAAPNDVFEVRQLIDQTDFLNVVCDKRRGVAYTTAWGRSSVQVVDLASGKPLAEWGCGLHPNDLVLASDGRLFVSNGGLNTVTVIDTHSGKTLETLSSSLRASDPPGSTPDSVALSADQKRLFVANAYTHNVAVFDVSEAGESRSLGFIPTGWFPSAVRLSPDGKTLLVLTARGLEAKADAVGWKSKHRDINNIYVGSLALNPLGAGDRFAADLSEWTKTAQQLRPAAAPAPRPDNPIPSVVGGPTPLRYVIYIIKENRTYDQVLGDMPEGNGDPKLCLFPQAITPNAHAIARRFVLLDNMFANAEVSASGHEWSMAGYSSEFVEKTWPVEYGHSKSNVPYAAEAHFKAAVPALGYIWDQAAAAGVSYRSYGEFVVGTGTKADPFTSTLASLQGHVDPSYVGWNQSYKDVDRAKRFISELHRFEAAGDMPRLQIMRLPQDHTVGARAKGWTPNAMVADNDLGLGQIVDAVSHSVFWPKTMIVVIEDDAQSGPDHVDAHRTVAYVASPYVKSGSVDSTPYTTCSLLRTMELVLGLAPMSPFDASAAPLWASFQATADLRPYSAIVPAVDMNARNPSGTALSRMSSRFDFSKEDMVDDRKLTRVIWKAVRGEDAEPPAPVHAAYVRTLPKGDDDDD